MSMFKTLGEQKRQLDNLISVSNAIKDLVVHSNLDGICDCYIDSNFHIYNLKIKNYDSIILESSIEFIVNQAIEKMQSEIQKRSFDILNGNNH